MSLTIRQTNSFKKTIKKLPKQYKAFIDNEVKKLSKNPMLGEKKKGDLDFLRVHKFKLHEQQMLLGYMYEEEEITLTLLKLSTHENFYRDIKKT